MVESYEQINTEDGWPDGDDDDCYDYAPDLNLGKGLNSQIDEPKLTRGFSFTLVEENEIERKQYKMINEIMELLNVSENIARALLIKFYWNKDLVIDSFTENENLLRQLFNID
jgi:hypothetical protein